MVVARGWRVAAVRACTAEVCVVVLTTRIELEATSETPVAMHPIVAERSSRPATVPRGERRGSVKRGGARTQAYGRLAAGGARAHPSCTRLGLGIISSSRLKVRNHG